MQFRTLNLMSELQFQVVLDDQTPREITNSVGFGDFEVKDDVSVVYAQDCVQQFYQDLVQGRPLPLTFKARGIPNLGTFFALFLFLQRDVVLAPKAHVLVSAVSLFDTFGIAGLSQVDRDLSRLLQHLSGFLRIPPKTPEDQNSFLQYAVMVCREYVLEGQLPNLPPELPPPSILDRGTNGFVLASTSNPNLFEGWEELYRQGYLKGVLLCSGGKDRWLVLGSRKSLYVGLDLTKAAAVLNDAETAMGEPAEWRSDGLWLVGPPSGTLLLPNMVVRILLVC